jgi:UDP-glucose 4-epimerase
MTKSVLLTGGFGNIGGRFSAFLAQFNDVDVVLSSRRELRPPNWAPNARTVSCDLTVPKSLDSATSGVDTIYHFASLNDRDCAADPRLANRVNVEGTKSLVESAVRNGVKRIVYMSTIHVYGSPLVGEFNETSPTIPTHPYGLTHLEAEDVLRSNSTNIQSVIVRSGNGFGYPMSPSVDIWHIIVNDLCSQAIELQQMTIKSPSNLQRNFVTLQDICRALYYLDDDALELGQSTTFNLGSRRSQTLRHMADLIASRYEKKFARKVAIVEAESPTNQNTSLRFDSSLLRQTGFSTIEDFETEIDGILEAANKRAGL